jgi:hypothetical protein
MLLALLSLAHAARIVVEVRNPVVIVVDESVIDSPDTGTVVATEHLPGRARVEARTALGRPLAWMTVDLTRPESEVRATYEDGAFRVDSALRGAVLVGTSAAPTQEATHAPSTLAACEGTLPPDLAGVPLGVAAVVVPTPPNLPRGVVDARTLERARHVARAQAFEALRTRACAPASGLPCRVEAGALAIHETTLPGPIACAAVALPPGPASQTRTAGGPIPPMPASMAPVTAQRSVELLRQDDTWANVFVDGELVAEFRVGDQKQTITLAPGPHRLEVRDFMNGTTWASGTLEVRASADPLKVGFAKGRRPVVYNDPKAFR